MRTRKPAKIPTVPITLPRSSWLAIQQSAACASVQRAHPHQAMMTRTAAGLAAKIDCPGDSITLELTDDLWRDFCNKFDYSHPGIDQRCMKAIDAIRRHLSELEFRQDRPRPVLVDPKLVAWAKADLAK